MRQAASRLRRCHLLSSQIYAMVDLAGRGEADYVQVHRRSCPRLRLRCPPHPPCPPGPLLPPLAADHSCQPVCHAQRDCLQPRIPVHRFPRPVQVLPREELSCAAAAGLSPSRQSPARVPSLLLRSAPAQPPSRRCSSGLRHGGGGCRHRVNGPPAPPALTRTVVYRCPAAVPPRRRRQLRTRPQAGPALRPHPAAGQPAHRLLVRLTYPHCSMRSMRFRPSCLPAHVCASGPPCSPSPCCHHPAMLPSAPALLPLRHGWKFIRFGPNGRLYIPIGANCNACRLDGSPPNNGWVRCRRSVSWAAHTASPHSTTCCSPRPCLAGAGHSLFLACAGSGGWQLRVQRQQLPGHSPRHRPLPVRT